MDKNRQLLENLNGMRKLMGINEVVRYNENIEAALTEAQEIINQAKRIFDAFALTVVNASLRDVYFERAKYTQQLATIKKAEDHLNEKHTKFFYMVDAFEVGSYPEPVKVLDGMVNNIDTLMTDFGYLSEALGELIDAVDRIGRNNREVFDYAKAVEAN